jgi:hypothetical protein
VATIELMGYINENGQLELDQTPHLPVGEVRVIIETLDIAADEALWDEQFAKSQDLLERMANKAIEEDEAGLTEEFDPDNDADAP